MCILSIYTLLKVVGYYDVSVLSRSLIGFQKKFGWEVGGCGLTLQSPLWSAVAQLVECRTRNRESPGSNPRCYRFEVWAFSFTSRRLSRLSCINEYLAIDSGGDICE